MLQINQKNINFIIMGAMTESQQENSGRVYDIRRLDAFLIAPANTHQTPILMQVLARYIGTKEIETPWHYHSSLYR